MRSVSMLLIFLLPSILSGCFGDDYEIDFSVENQDECFDPLDRKDCIYDDTDVFSRVTENGTYEIGQVQSVYVPVPSITLADGGAVLGFE